MIASKVIHIIKLAENRGRDSSGNPAVAWEIWQWHEELQRIARPELRENFE